MVSRPGSLRNDRCAGPGRNQGQAMRHDQGNSWGNSAFEKKKTGRPCGRPVRATLLRFHLAAGLGAIFLADFGETLALAGILAFAGILRALAGALALAGVA